MDKEITKLRATDKKQAREIAEIKKIVRDLSERMGLAEAEIQNKTSLFYQAAFDMHLAGTELAKSRKTGFWRALCAKLKLKKKSQSFALSAK